MGQDTTTGRPITAAEVEAVLARLDERDPRTRVVDALLDDLAEIEVDVDFDDLDPRGNILASGDDELDARVEGEVLARLENGDVWAWAVVRIVARFDGFEGVAVLGGVSVAGESEFEAAYGAELRREAVGELADALLASGLYGDPGSSLSHGTLRPEDLGPAFADELDRLREARVAPRATTERVPVDWVREVGDADRLLGEFEGLRQGRGEDWVAVEGVGEVLDGLADALDRWAPPGFYFGASMGDGSDFGFWAVDPEGPPRWDFGQIDRTELDDDGRAFT